MDGDQSQEKIRQQIEKTVSNVDWSEESAEVVFVTKEEELENLYIEDDDFVIYLSIKMKPKNSKTADVKPAIYNMKPIVNTNDCNKSHSQALVKQNTLHSMTRNVSVSESKIENQNDPFSLEKQRPNISKKSNIMKPNKIETKGNKSESESDSMSSTDSDDLEIDFASLR